MESLLKVREHKRKPDPLDLNYARAVSVERGRNSSARKEPLHTGNRKVSHGNSRHLLYFL